MIRRRLQQNDWPVEIQNAIDAFPQVDVSSDFNQRVFAALAEKQITQSKTELFCDVIDRVFGRPILKLLGAAVLALLFGWSSSFLFVNGADEGIPFSISASENLPQNSLSLLYSHAQMQQSLLSPPSQSTSHPTVEEAKKLHSLGKNKPSEKEVSCLPNATFSSV